MSALNEFLEKVPTEQHALIRSLDTVISKAAPKLGASLKWGNLTYHAKTNVCSLVSHRNHVNLQVWGGASLKDPAGCWSVRARRCGTSRLPEKTISTHRPLPNSSSKPRVSPVPDG